MPNLLPGHHPKTISQIALFFLVGEMILAFLLLPGALSGIDLSYQTATLQPTHRPAAGLSLPGVPSTGSSNTHEKLPCELNFSHLYIHYHDWRSHNWAGFYATGALASLLAYPDSARFGFAAIPWHTLSGKQV